MTTLEEVPKEDQDEASGEDMQDVDLNAKLQEPEQDGNMETTGTTALDTEEGTENIKEDGSDETQGAESGNQPANGSKKRKQKRGKKARRG